MRAAPHSASDIHHHGEQDTIVYAVSGRGCIVSEGGLFHSCALLPLPNTFQGTKRQSLSPGDWAIIPAYAEHQEANEGEEEVVWVIVRGPGGLPVVENLGGWKKEEAEGK